MEIYEDGEDFGAKDATKSIPIFFAVIINILRIILINIRRHSWPPTIDLEWIKKYIRGYSKKRQEIKKEKLLKT